MLEMYLEKFKKLTMNIVIALEKEDFDLMDTLIEKRQFLINSMGKEEYTQEEFKKLALKYNIVELQKRLDKVIEEKRNFAKQEIQNTQKSKQAYKSYNSKFLNNSYFIKEKR